MAQVAERLCCGHRLALSWQLIWRAVLYREPDSASCTSAWRSGGLLGSQSWRLKINRPKLLTLRSECAELGNQTQEMFMFRIDALQLRIAVTNWSALPAPVWFLIASPLLTWSFGCGRWFKWPVGCSKSPLRASFWRVSNCGERRFFWQK